MLRAAQSFLGNRSQAAGSTLASYVFNGTNEIMTSSQGFDATDKTRFTASFWAKQGDFSGEFLPHVFIESSHSSNDELAWMYSGPDFLDMNLESINSSDTIVGYEFTAEDTVDITNTWEHWVLRWDSTQGTSDNRIRMYRNGTLLSDSSVQTPGSSALFHFFSSSHTIRVGNGLGFFSAKRMAFIDVLDGVSAAPTDFAFDDGGTWTRKPYTGSYGTYGFRLDGSNGFNDASGNGRTFTATLMDASNLDAGDLPPYTT